MLEKLEKEDAAKAELLTEDIRATLITRQKANVMRQMLTTTRDMDIDNISLNANDAEDILDKKENELIELGQSLD